MDATEHTEALRAKLDAVDRERAARNELVGNTVRQGLAEARRRSDDLIMNAGAVATRLNQRAARDADGWQTSGTIGQPDDEVNFEVSEPETPASPWQPPAPRPTPPPRTRRGQAGDADTEDDFASTKWWDG